MTFVKRPSGVPDRITTSGVAILSESELQDVRQLR